jgi:hypothetical protein
MIMLIVNKNETHSLILVKLIYRFPCSYILSMEFLLLHLFISSHGILALKPPHFFPWNSYPYISSFLPMEFLPLHLSMDN